MLISPPHALITFAPEQVEQRTENAPRDIDSLAYVGRYSDAHGEHAFTVTLHPDDRETLGMWLKEGRLSRFTLTFRIGHSHHRHWGIENLTITASRNGFGLFEKTFPRLQVGQTVVWDMVESAKKREQIPDTLTFRSHGEKYFGYGAVRTSSLMLAVSYVPEDAVEPHAILSD